MRSLGPPRLGYRFGVMRGVALLAVVGLTGVARAQETVAAVDGYRVDVWRAEHGLPVNVVLRIAQSGDGYLWLATTNGATRFDGVRFTTFDHNDPPFHGRIDYAIQPMLGDRRGVLWIATDRELVRYADGRFVRDAALDDSVVGESIVGLTEDASGTLWGLTDHGRLLRRDGSRLAPVSMCLSCSSVRSPCKNRMPTATRRRQPKPSI